MALGGAGSRRRKTARKAAASKRSRRAGKDLLDTSIANFRKDLQEASEFVKIDACTGAVVSMKDALAYLKDAGGEKIKKNPAAMRLLKSVADRVTKKCGSARWMGKQYRILKKNR